MQSRLFFMLVRRWAVFRTRTTMDKLMQEWCKQTPGYCTNDTLEIWKTAGRDAMEPSDISCPSASPFKTFSVDRRRRRRRRILQAYTRDWPTRWGKRQRSTRRNFGIPVARSSLLCAAVAAAAAGEHRNAQRRAKSKHGKSTPTKLKAGISESS